MERSDEEQMYWDEHFRIHGHHPIPDLSGKRMCAHVSHDILHQVMTQPGIVLEFPFDGREVHTIDDPAVMAYEAAYEKEVDYYRDLIADLEEREAFKEREEKKRLF